MIEEAILTPQQIKTKVDQTIKEYERRSYDENYATFMKKAQLLEYCLKQMLLLNYGEKKKVLKMPLGPLIECLRKNNIREDFVCLLDEFLPYRNTMAHSHYVDKTLEAAKGKKSAKYKEIIDDFGKGCRLLEEINIILQWLIEHKATSPISNTSK